MLATATAGRSVSALCSAATVLEQGGNPLGPEFLERANLTDGEVMLLAQDLGTGARLLAWLLSHQEYALAILRSGDSCPATAQLAETLHRVRS